MLNSPSFDTFLCKKEKVSNFSIPGEKSLFLLSLIKTYWVQLWSVLYYFGSTLFFLYNMEGEKISSFPSQLPSNCVQELNNAWISTGLFKEESQGIDSIFIFAVLRIRNIIWMCIKIVQIYQAFLLLHIELALPLGNQIYVCSLSTLFSKFAAESASWSFTYETSGNPESLFLSTDDMEAIPVKQFVKHISELYSNNQHGFSEDFEVWFNDPLIKCCFPKVNCVLIVRGCVTSVWCCHVR